MADELLQLADAYSTIASIIKKIEPSELTARSEATRRLPITTGNSAQLLIDGKETFDAILDGIPDPAGSFYRFSLPHSLLQAARPAWFNGNS